MKTTVTKVAVRQMKTWEDFVSDHPTSDGDLQVIRARCDGIKRVALAVFEEVANAGNEYDWDGFYAVMAAWNAAEKAIMARLARADGCYAK